MSSLRRQCRARCRHWRWLDTVKGSGWHIVMVFVGDVFASLQVEGSLLSAVMYVEEKDKVMWLL